MISLPKKIKIGAKKLPKLFHYGFTEKLFKQKGPECPFKLAKIL